VLVWTGKLEFYNKSTQKYGFGDLKGLCEHLVSVEVEDNLCLQSLTAIKRNPETTKVSMRYFLSDNSTLIA